MTNSQIRYINSNLMSEIIEILNRRPIMLLGKVPRLSFDQIEIIYKTLNKKLTKEEKAIAAVQEWLISTESRGWSALSFRFSTLTTVKRGRVSKLRFSRLRLFPVQLGFLFN